MNCECNVDFNKKLAESSAIFIPRLQLTSKCQFMLTGTHSPIAILPQQF